MKLELRSWALVCLFTVATVVGGSVVCLGQTGSSTGNQSGSSKSPVKKPLWIYHYRCEYAAADDCAQAPYSDHRKSFKTRSEAIDWANRNYRFYPLGLEHGPHMLFCSAEYLYPESDDQDRRLMKSVECSPVPEQAGGYVIVGGAVSSWVQLDSTIHENVDTSGGQSGPEGDMASWNDPQ